MRARGLLALSLARIPILDLVSIPIVSNNSIQELIFRVDSWDRRSVPEDILKHGRYSNVETLLLLCDMHGELPYRVEIDVERPDWPMAQRMPRMHLVHALFSNCLPTLDDVMKSSLVRSWSLLSKARSLGLLKTSFSTNIGADDVVGV
jgi:hypothetical protein